MTIVDEMPDIATLNKIVRAEINKIKGKNAMNLYEISNRYQQLIDKDELTTEECAELESLFDNAEDACIEKAKYIRNLEAEAALIDNAIAEMNDRLKSLKNKADCQRDKLINEMQRCNLDKITKSPLFAISIPKPRASVVIFDDSLIPEKYISTEQKTVSKISKDELKHDLQDGIEIPGAALNFNTKVVFK